MVIHMGPLGLQVKDVGRAADFLSTVLGLELTERAPGRAYLTSNTRHHELILIQSSSPGYDHVGLEVADAEALHDAEHQLRAAGARIVGYEEDPGIERALRLVVTGGHVLRLFHGMEERSPLPDNPDRPVKFEHVQLSVRDKNGVEDLLERTLGFGLSDRVGKLVSWWHCDDDHHGIALARWYASRLHHYAWKFADVGAVARTADRAAASGHRLAFGLGRHGPGNNHYIYFPDTDGFLVECCSELAQLGPGSTYELGRTWTREEIALWERKPPLAFIRAGRPVASSAGSPSPAHLAEPRVTTPEGA